ncbi:MAG: hypothetical protein IT355_05710 [Gemmatimonadaceae bacterium]|nr:hypothetical protein [Gemmatimonadaceae bacterium]
MLAGTGVAVWGAGAWLQPLAALQVSGAAVALVFAWEVAGVLETLVQQRR